jgi:hypothetical protein
MMVQIRRRLALATLLSVIAVLALAACSSGAESPAETSVPTKLPTETPVPIIMISVNPETDPEGFLAALPAPEVDCATRAAGGHGRLVRLISSAGDEADGISDTQLRDLASCIGNDTIKGIFIGQLNIETGGLSDATIACISQHTDGIDFAGVFSGQVIETDAIVSTLQALFCLSPKERAAFETSGTELVSVDTLGGIDALECAVDGVGPDGIQIFADMSGSSGEVDPLAVSKFMPRMIECGIDLQALIDASSSTGAGTGLGETSNVTEDISVDLLFCLTENGVSPVTASNYAAGLVHSSDPSIASALALCAGGTSETGSSESGITVPDGSGGTTTIDPAVFDTLPITADLAQCLINEIGAEQLAGIADGTVSPLTALAALGACDIAITDLLGG